MAKTDDIRAQVEKLISDDPTLTDPTKIISSVTKEGPLFKKRTTVILEGKVANDAEKRKVEQIIDSHFRDAVAVKNDLAVNRK